MLERVGIVNYRGIGSLDINDFQQFNLIVGKNNVGKTTVLEALFMLINPGNPDLLLKVNAFRSINLFGPIYTQSFFHNLDIGRKIELQTAITLKNSKRQSRMLTIERMPSTKSTFSYEESDDLELYSTNIYSSPDLLLTARIKTEGEGTRDFTSKIYLSRESELKQELKIEPAKDYKEGLRGFFLQYSNRRDIHRLLTVIVSKKKDELLEILKEIEPRVIDIALIGDVVFCDYGLKDMLPINFLGSGLNKIVDLMASIMSAKDGIVIIDEIENGMHYTSQDVMWNAIIRTAKRYNVQIFAATHSFECVKMYSKNILSQKSEGDLYRLIRIERDDEKYNPISYNSEELANSIESDWEVR